MRGASLPELGTLLPTLQRTHPVPFRPLFSDKFLGVGFELPCLHGFI
jgi:hypothetical protein